jgi:hypothetical protein
MSLLLIGTGLTVGGFATIRLANYVQQKRFEATLTPQELAGFRVWMHDGSWRDYVKIIEAYRARADNSRQGPVECWTSLGAHIRGAREGP